MLYSCTLMATVGVEELRNSLLDLDLHTTHRPHVVVSEERCVCVHNYICGHVFMQCLLGDNYGTVPLPAAIDEEEFRQLRNELDESDEGQFVCIRRDLFYTGIMHISLFHCLVQS